MKALMKLAGAAKFFQRAEKKKQQITDDDVRKYVIQRMFQAEQLVIAEEIGIDPVQITNTRWFFDQTRLMKLPQNWRREFLSDRVAYINDVTNEQQYMHPNIGLLKVFYYERLANDKSAATFTDKSRKLLPHIEEKLSKEMIGLSSKRKQAEKVNLKRDEQGKYVTSKTVRIAPDTSKLMASRNYLLKSIVDKVVTKQELWGYGKRARQYAGILDKNKATKVVPGFGQEQEQVETLELMDRIYAEAFEFYEIEYRDLTGMPAKIDQRTFKLLTPETVVMCLQLLGIGKEQIEHYWLGQVMNCLVLPPLWRRHKGGVFDEFVYEPKNLTFDLHPSFIYMIEQRNRFMKRYQSMSISEQQHYLSFRQMQFIDFFERTFVVDIYAILQKFQTQIHKKTKSQKVRHVNDWLILEGLQTCNVEQQNFMLADHVEDFWKSKNFMDEIWAPSVSPYGQVLWNHNVTGSCVEKCPYQAELVRYLQPFLQKVEAIGVKDYKPMFEEFAGVAEFQEMLEGNLKEKMRFLENYLQEPNNQFAVSKGYDVQRFFEQAFMCPFNFEQSLNTSEELPLWLQICRARKLHSLLYQLLSSDPPESSLDFLYSLVKKYYLEATLRRQPNNLETVRSSLAQSMTKQQLLKFIDYVFDIGQREERLRQQSKKVEVVERRDEEDIFGSSQSQIDLNQYSTEEEQQEYSILEPQKAVLEEEEPSEEEEVDDEDKTPEQSREEAQQTGKIQLTEQSFKVDPKKVTVPSKEDEESYQDQTILDSKIKSIKKKTLKVRKFSPRRQQQPLELIQKVNRLSSKEQRLRCKKNLILSNLKKQQLPDKQTLFNSPIKKSRVQSQNVNSSELPTVNLFNSTLSNYSNDTIVSLINKIPKKSIPEVVVRPPSPIRLVKVTSVESQQESEESVLELTPIVKENIKNDPVLRHVSRFGQIGDFCNTFRFSTADTTEDSEMFKSSALGRTRRLDDIDRQQIKSCQRIFRTTSIAKNSQQLSPEKLRPSQTTSNFKRRCLSSTASHLLNSNALTSRLAFEKIEVRKQLYLQNRGIRDFLPH